MAKVTPPKETVTPVATSQAVSTADLQKMYEEMGMSPEQIAELLDLTGQSAAYNMERTPVLKINKFGIEDNNGKTVPMGHFVLGQIAKEKGDDVEIDEIGEDYGKNPEISVLKFGTQFTYFPASKDKKSICCSQIVLDAGEKATGSRLKYECQDKTCPMREENRPKTDRCVCSTIAFTEVTNKEGVKKKALMYFKGTSFMPFQDYVKDAGKFPLFFAPTKLNTERKINGNNVYWIVKPQLLKETPYAADVRMINFDTAKEINTNVREFESQRKLRNESAAPQQRQLAEHSSAPQGRTAATHVGMMAADDVSEVEF